ncbi:hypothetical protein [Corynebacterium riegelii]|uniref:hypothetical protein n=1 Tax=Corynebacterium riegelii TaxID=156976 RepID=UPI00191F3B22|nr:hypothetical protein [Corynebacterium riegelii]QQU83471.1 hypothetical protein I6I71_08680 [Corynebacterium riegelii]
MTEPYKHDEIPNEPENGSDFPSGDSTRKGTEDTSTPTADFHNRPLTDFEGENLNDIWRKNDPEGYAAMQKTVQPIVEKAWGKSLRKLDSDFVTKIAGKQLSLPPSVWETWAKTDPAFFSPALSETFAHQFASFNTSVTHAAAEKASLNLAPSMKRWLNAGNFADCGPLEPLPELPDLSDTAQRQFDTLFASLNEQLKDLAFPPHFLDSVKKLSEPYAKILPFARQDPLPFLKRFGNDFLVLYASVVLAASRVENLLADLADVLFSDEELAGLSAEAHSFGDGLRKSIANNGTCGTCAGIAKDLAKPFAARNTYVHAKWKVGKEIASKEEKARRALEFTLFPETVVTKRERMVKNKIKALVGQWENGKKDAFDALFHSEVVSLGLVAALSETFTEAGNALERELEIHERALNDEHNLSK